MKDARMLFVLGILIAATLTPFVANDDSLDPSSNSEYTEGRAQVDMTILDITAGNVSTPAEVWTQSSGTTQDYLIRNTLYEVTITFKNAGTGFSSVDSTGTLEIIHPIGFVMQMWEFNMSGQYAMAGGQTRTEVVEWTPTASHSYVDEIGDLAGGLIFRGSIETGALELQPQRGNNEYQESFPVAVWHDNLEPTQPLSFPGYGNPLFVPVAYETRYPTPTLYPGGTDWQPDNSSAAAGNRHWRMSNSGGDYPSNNVEMLRWGWFTNSQGDCADSGHGLGYGQYDSDITAYYSQHFCTANIGEYDYKSLHWVTNAYGSMAQGDELAMEALRSFFPSDIQQLNLTEQSLSTTAGDWTQVVWNMTDVHDEQAFMISYSKIADEQFANEGIHIDDFVLLGIDRVEEFTVTLECDDPLPNAYVVIPADPNPPSLYCELTNNGYREKTMTINTEVSNQTWMANYPLRIDSNNVVDHDNVVTLSPLDGETTTYFWINLTIPEGANVETLNWTVEISNNNFGSTEEKASMLIPVSVDSSYSVRIQQVESTGQNVALTLEPGQTGDIEMRIKNTGNKYADWNLGAYFDSTLWCDNCPNDNLAWLEDWDGDGNMTEITQLGLSKSEERYVTARFTSPLQMPPGLVEVSLLASGVPPASAQSIKQVIIEVPVIQDVSVEAQQSSLMASANGFTRTMPITITNNGNAPEYFDVLINADIRLQAYLNTEITEEIDPFGGQTTVMVILPMNPGLPDEMSPYQVTVTARSKTDSSHSSSGSFDLSVPVTYLTEVQDYGQLTEQTFTPGENAKTLRFEIFNHGNDPDAFTIDMALDSGVIASISSGVSDGRTPYIDPGTSTNITISYSFSDGTSGLRTMTITSTSVSAASAGETITASGEAIFDVGEKGWLLLEPSQPIEIDEPGTYSMSVRILNRHPDRNQEIDLQVITDGTERWDYVDKIRPGALDVAGFSLDPGVERIITIEIRLTETNLENLPQDSMDYNFTVRVAATDDTSDIVLSFTTNQFSESSNSDSESSDDLLKSIAIWTLGGLVIIALLAVLVKIIISTEHEDEISTLSGYESNLELPDAPSLPEAPTLPSADLTANSMYGGTQELFEQPVMTTPPAPESTVASDPAPVPEPAPAAGPPLPESGLPEGWSMEQWTHYGEEYLRRQNES
ncbi:MAG: hypothetical protein QF440_04000 [Candidatus Thalassarchaeaceae archaeon]|nr:hypothetical protein [Candidatus Thalassarchaeaceae archaeon]